MVSQEVFTIVEPPTSREVQDRVRKAVRTGQGVVHLTAAQPDNPETTQFPIMFQVEQHDIGSILATGYGLEEERTRRTSYIVSPTLAPDYSKPAQIVITWP